ncbi:MAG: DUF6498-containing protein [Candidatus Margulisiibacteriota bacterium]
MRKSDWHNPPSSGIFLIVANIVPLLGVIFLGWDMLDILSLYWAETAIIGLFNMVMIFYLPNKYEGRSQWFANLMDKISELLDFIVIFVWFVPAQAAIIYFLAKDYLKTPIDPLEILSATWFALAIILASHGYSFVANFIVKGERKKLANANDLPSYFLSRTLALHGTLLLGLSIISFLGQPLLLLALFIIFKTGVDFKTYQNERKKFAK